MKPRIAHARPTGTPAPAPDSPLAQVLARQDYHFAARLLLVGMARTIEKMPDGAMEELLGALRRFGVTLDDSLGPSLRSGRHLIETAAARPSPLQWASLM